MPEVDDKGGQASDPTTAFQNRLAKMNGDAMAFATQLFDENFKLRNDKRELEAKIPGADSVVLKKEDADRLAAFDALGLKPKDVKAKLDGLSTVESERDTLKRKDTLRDVASAAGFKLSVLQDLDAKAETPLEYVIKDDPKDKARKAAFVKREGKEISLEQFASETWPDYLPALKADAGQPPKPGNGRDPNPAGNLSAIDAVRAAEKTRQGAAGSQGVSLKERFLGRRASA